MANKFLGIPKVQYFDSNGDPLSGGKLSTFEPGTTTNKASYPTIADADAATNANANPVVLDSRGEADVVLLGNTKLVLKDSSDNTLWTVDNVDTSSETELLDANGNSILIFSASANAVNEFTMANAATGVAPKLSSTGTDSNINMDIQTKGTGVHKLLDGNGNEALTTQSGIASAVNNLSVSNAATGNDPKILTEGGDTNITLELESKGSGNIKLDPGSTGDVDIEGASILIEDNEGIKDDSNNELLIFQKTSTAVNHIEITNAASAGAPSIAATGGDTNINLDLQAKGTGKFVLKGTSTAPAELQLSEDTDNGTNYMGFKAPSAVTTSLSLEMPDGDGTNGQVMSTNASGVLSWTNPGGDLVDDLTPQLGASLDCNSFDVQFDDATGLRDDSNNEQLILQKTASAVNHFEMTNAATLSDPKLAAVGADTNINFVFEAKGTGAYILNGSSTSAAEIRLAEDTDNGTNYVGLKAGASLSSSITYTWPTADGSSSGDSLVTDSSGVLSFSTRLANVVEDTTPQLGADLDANSFDIAFDDNTGIRDSNDNEQLTFQLTASAVNNLEVTNAATGSSPKLSVAGGDANIDLTLQCKGTGALVVRGTADTAAEIRLREDTDNGTNYIGLKPAAAITSSSTLTLPEANDTLIGKATTDILTNKTFDANGTGNSLSNVDVADLANGTDGELITWNSSGVATTVGTGVANEILTSNGAGAEPTFQSKAASKTEMEAASSATVFATPATTHNHPGVAKMWVKFAIVAGTPTIDVSYNVDALVDNGVGDTSVTITTDFSGNNYVIATGMDAAPSSGTNWYWMRGQNQAVGSTRLFIYNESSSPADPGGSSMFISAYGDQ